MRTFIAIICGLAVSSCAWKIVEGDGVGLPPNQHVQVGGTKACQQIDEKGRRGDAGKIYSRQDGIVTFISDADVNTDGSLRSYKIDDLGHFEGKRLTTHSALNVICNGVNIRRQLGTTPADGDPVEYNYSKCTSLISAFKGIRENGWKPVDKLYVDFYAIELAADGQPCEQNGYYVSTVSRRLKGKFDRCSPAAWLDAMRIPAIVIPNSKAMRNAGVRQHDLAVVRVPGSSAWHGAVVGDTGGGGLGEVTVRLAMMLKGAKSEPANYRDVLALKIPTVEYVIFPGSAGQLQRLSNESSPDIEAGARLLRAQHKLDASAVCEGERDLNAPIADKPSN